jgi:hypothetical protein
MFAPADWSLLFYTNNDPRIVPKNLFIGDFQKFGPFSSRFYSSDLKNN